MELNGTFDFNADQQTVWDALMNPDVIAKAIPGVQEMVAVEGEFYAWRAIAKVGVANIVGTYNGLVKITDIDAPDRYRLTVSGEGQQSIIGGTALLELSYDSETKQTHLIWTAEANIAGKLASIGQRLIKAAAGLLSKQFFQGVARQIPTSQVT
jgi:carbon monoxide dehydrogenase subunit G